MCDFGGFYAEASAPEFGELLNAKGLPEVYITRVNKPCLMQPMKLHDARTPSNGTRNHQLAICTQPLFYYVDWTLIAQFFEMWILQGVTKFYIYFQSLAFETDALLRVYENEATIDVERIPWSAFPTDGDFLSKPENDPNNRVCRLEVLSAINDCVLRSRGHTKFVISY
ncbi:unnamed protein product [Gongylonema pulchrum]|uniref:Glycosyltransferase family 92 protein n=1 Tax=Gongylonema pulchrum TaxID=637853 RepID=A0A183CZX7_9BILA|nr:unnamed protein product [Gongylonema pulchrum]